MSEEKKTVSVEEAGRMLGISRNCAYASVKRGEIPVIKLGTAYRVPIAKLKALLGEAA